MRKLSRAGELVKQRILHAAVYLAEKQGYALIARDSIAMRAGVANGAINYYFTNMPKLKDDIIRHAIDQRNLTIVAQAVGNKHRLVENLPQELWLQAVTNGRK